VHDEGGEISIGTRYPRGKARVVSVDGHEVRTTSVDALAAACIKGGDRMAPGTLDTMLAEVESEAASARAMTMLGHRERSPAELAARLTEDGYPAHVVRDVVARMEEIGAVDKDRFAEVYIRWKIASGWGRDRIVRGLRSAGIESDHASALVEEASPDAREFDRALTMLPDYPPHDRGERERILRRLVSRGFSYDVASRALDHRSHGDEE